MSTWVPAFDGPKGTFGHTFKEASTIKSVTTNTDMPEEVFNTFMEWYIASDNGIISTSRGVEGYSFDVVDGVMVPNADNGGVSYVGQGFPPVDLDYEYPFKFDPITQGEYDNILAIFDDYYAHPMAQTVIPGAHNQEYYTIVDDWEDGAYGCFWKYVLGEWTYDEYMEGYDKLAKGWNLQEILDGITE